MPTDARREYLRKYQNEWMQKRRREWLDANGPCKHCGSSEALNVDHIDATTKTMPSAQIWSRRPEVREAELSLCQVLCLPCHRAKTAREQEHARGERNGSSRWTSEQVREMRAMRKEGSTYTQIAKHFGAGDHAKYVWGVINHDWQHV